MCKNLILRSASTDDAKQLISIYAPYVENTAVSLEHRVPSAPEFRRRIEFTKLKYPFIVAEVEGRVVGYCYAGSFHARRNFDWEAELSIFVDKDFHGQGIGSALYSEMEKQLVDAGIVTLYACISSTPRENDAYLSDDGIRFHETHGYHLCGTFTRCAKKFNEWYNIVYMEKHLKAS